MLMHALWLKLVADAAAHPAGVQGDSLTPHRLPLFLSNRLQLGLPLSRDPDMRHVRAGQLRLASGEQLTVVVKGLKPGDRAYRFQCREMALHWAVGGRAVPPALEAATAEQHIHPHMPAMYGVSWSDEHGLMVVMEHMSGLVEEVGWSPL